MAQRANSDGLELGLVTAAAVAAGVAVAILSDFPFSGLGQRENIVLVIVAGIVIVASGGTVGWAMLRRGKPRRGRPPDASA